MPCDPAAPYRTYSGYCNNLANPNFGKSVTPQHRLLPAQYDDGTWQRTSSAATDSGMWAGAGSSNLSELCGCVVSCHVCMRVTTLMVTKAKLSSHLPRGLVAFVLS